MNKWDLADQMILCQLVTMSLVSLLLGISHDSTATLSGYQRYTQFCHFSCSRVIRFCSCSLYKLCPFQFVRETWDVVRFWTFHDFLFLHFWHIAMPKPLLLLVEWKKSHGEARICCSKFCWRGRRIICVRSENNEIIQFKWRSRYVWPSMRVFNWINMRKVSRMLCTYDWTSAVCCCLVLESGWW